MGKPRGSKKLPVMRYWKNELMSFEVVQVAPLTPLTDPSYALGLRAALDQMEETKKKAEQ